MPVEKGDEIKSHNLPSYTQGRSERVVQNITQGITIALFFTVVGMEKQKVIFMPEAKHVIKTVSSINRPCSKK